MRLPSRASLATFLRINTYPDPFSPRKICLSTKYQEEFSIKPIQHQMMTDNDARHQERTLYPTSTSLSTLPLEDVFLAAMTTKGSSSKWRPSSVGPPVPPRNPARSRRPATSGSGAGVSRQHELSTSLAGVPPTIEFSVTTGPYVAGYGPKLPKIHPKSDSSSVRSDGARPRSMAGWQRRSSHDLTRQSHNPVPSTSSPATPAPPRTSSKRRPTTTPGVLPTLTTFTAEEKRDLKSADLQATTMTKPYFVTKNGKKHHSFSSKRAPYPRNYERESLDQYVWP